MSTTLLEPRPFTADEYHAMADAGLFDEDSRVELIDGVIVAMSPIGAAQITCVNRQFVRLMLERGLDVTVGVKNPFRLGSKCTAGPARRGTPKSKRSERGRGSR